MKEGKLYDYYQALVWGTDYEDVPFSHVYPKPRPRYQHLNQILTTTFFKGWN